MNKVYQQTKCNNFGLKPSMSQIKDNTSNLNKSYSKTEHFKTKLDNIQCRKNRT